MAQDKEAKTASSLTPAASQLSGRSNQLMQSSVETGVGAGVDHTQKGSCLSPSKQHGRQPASFILRFLPLLLGAWLVGCCDLRWAIDDAKGLNAYKPVIIGAPLFELEVYAHPNFDLAHSDIGQKRISMNHKEVKLIGQNFARSLILRAPPGTGLEITTNNNKKGVGRVVAGYELKITDICLDNSDGSYKTEGILTCRITRMVIREGRVR